MKYKDKITKEIKEIGRGIIGATMVRKIDNTENLTVKGISTLFRAWADIVIPKLIKMPDKFAFDALLEDKVMSPELVEWREKNDITLDDIKDMLLLASSEISSKYPDLQPLSEIKVKWLNEWFDNEYKGAMTTPEPPTKGDATLFDLMLLDNQEQKQKLLDVLHKLIDNRKGKDVALVILVCEKYGLMRKPSHQILKKFFSNIGAKSGYNNYHSKGLGGYAEEEIKGIETHILPFIVER